MDDRKPNHRPVALSARDAPAAAGLGEVPLLRQHWLLAAGLVLLLLILGVLLLTPDGGEQATAHGGMVLAVLALVALILSWVLGYRALTRANLHQRRLLARMRETEDQYRFLFERNPLPAYVFHRESHHILAVNDALLHEYGYAREELVGSDAIEFVAPACRELALTASREWSDHERRSHAWRHVRRDGSELDVLTFGSNIDFEGQPARLVVVQDISERLRNEARREESESRFRLVALATSDAIYDWDVRRDALWWSDGFYEIFDVDRGEFGPDLRGWLARIHPEDRARIEASLQQALDGSGSLWTDRYRFRRGDDEYADVAERGFILRDERGRPVRMVGGMLDISERLRDETDLRLLRRAMESASNGVLVVRNGEGHMPVAYVNPAFEAISGFAESDLLGRALHEVSGSLAGWRQALMFIGDALDRRREGRSLTRLVDSRGEDRWLELQVAPVRDAEGRVTHYLSVVSDVTDREQAQEALAHRATHDELTGLPNRRMIVERIDSLVEGLQTPCALSVLFIDLDHFKLINDTLGHAAGDRFLQIVSQRLSTSVPDADMVGRFGGDEFVVVLHDHPDGRAARDASSRILGILTEPLESDDRLHYLTPSIGYAIAPEAGRDADTLLKHADMAMYEAKRRGRNSAMAWHPRFEIEVSERLHLVSRLRDALARDEFQLHFQLQFDAEDGEPVGVEALLRWRHPQRGLLKPDTFITAAEQSGVIVAIGDWVLREAARTHARLVAAGWPELPISVNVSAAQFLHGELADYIDRIVTEFALPPLALELELTESVVLEDPAAAIATMQRLRARGVAIAIDDFGTGYSSLGYLRELPADKLKLDRAFVADLGREPKATAICALVIRIAQSLGLRVVAEGVESAEQLDWLKRQGCDQVQGFLLAHPVPFDDLLKQLARAPRRSRSAVA
jgi:diguanylate cyclase (GGDEF)-like protein/PAS domain S-box-containing protein